MSKPADFYSREATSYDELRWQTKAGKYTDEVQQEILFDLIGNIEGRNVLEIGAGTGRFTKGLVNHGASVTAVDIAFPMLVRNRENISGKCKFVQSDASKLPFHSESFDVCVSVNVLSHIHDYRTMLSEIARVLLPGGFMIVNFPNFLSYYFPVGVYVNLRKRSIRHDVYTKWYSLFSIKNAFKLAGLQIQEIVGQVHLKNEFERLGLNSIFKMLDRFSRRSIFRYFSPTLFIKAEKQAPNGGQVFILDKTP